MSAILLADSKWTRRDSNPSHRNCPLAFVRFDTHRTPQQFSISEFRFSIWRNERQSKIINRKSKITRQVVVPPILFYSVICLETLRFRRSVRTRQTAATGHFAFLQNALLPCSPLDIHPATVIADNAGGLLPHRFIPHLLKQADILSVAVVVRTSPAPTPLSGEGRGEVSALACCFTRQRCIAKNAMQRVGKFLSLFSHRATEHLLADIFQLLMGNTKSVFHQ